MSKPTQIEAEMRDLNRQMPFTSELKDKTDEETNIPIRDPDAILTTIVLLLACLVLAVLAHAVI
jgi:hypothetical protein